MIGFPLCSSSKRLRKCSPTTAGVLDQILFLDDLRKWVERTMSVKLPPQVELIRLGTRKQFSLTLIERGPAITPQTWAFFPNAIRSGRTPKCSLHQLRR
jgi:hypothetical protein